MFAISDPATVTPDLADRMVEVFFDSRRPVQHVRPAVPPRETAERPNPTQPDRFRSLRFLDCTTSRTDSSGRNDLGIADLREPCAQVQPLAGRENGTACSTLGGR